MDRQAFHPLGIFLLATMLALSWCFIFYPYIGELPDSDYWGALGRGLLKNGTLSYYPSDEPSIQRGPIYPLFVALCLFLSGDAFPQAIQIGQSLLFGGAAALSYASSLSLFGKRSALVAGLLTACHPFLIWYTSRIWVECLLIFFFSALIYATTRSAKTHSAYCHLTIGTLIGILSLAKGVFLPFLIFIPLFYLFWQGKRAAFLIFLSGLIIVMPWTLRNYSITGKIVPVHTLLGYNLQRGDDFIDHLDKAPFSYGKLWHFSNRSNAFFQDDKVPSIPIRWKYEYAFDKASKDASLNRYKKEPFFLIEKMAYNSIAFWFLAHSELTTALFFFLQTPLILLFAYAFFRQIKSVALISVFGLHGVIFLLYYLPHLPIIAFARLSVILIPLMLIYASSLCAASAPFRLKY